MKVVIQRVKEAKVTVEGREVGAINQGILVLLGIHKNDHPDKTRWLVSKLVNLRLFSDEQDKMNLSLKDIGGAALVVSQFTLYANCFNGRRPDFIESAPGNQALPIYEKFVNELRQEIPRVQTGEFGAKMDIFLVNDGPVTLIIEN